MLVSCGFAKNHMQAKLMEFKDVRSTPPKTNTHTQNGYGYTFCLKPSVVVGVVSMFDSEEYPMQR